MLIGELINNLAQKAGIAVDNDDLKGLLAAPELANVKVPDELVSTIDKNLLSIEAAMNNHPDIKKKYSSQILDGMDKNLLKLIESDTFDQVDVDEIKAENNTYKKAELIITKLKEAKSKATGVDKETINKQLKDAHEAARLAKEEVTTVKNDYEGKIKTIYKDAALDAAIANYKTIYDELPGKAKKTAMKAVIEEALQDKNAELGADEQGNLVLVSKDGSSNVFGSNHVQLTPKSFLDQTFAPILKNSGPPQPANPQRQAPTTTTPADKDDATNGFIKSHNAQVLADIARPKATMI